MSERPIGDRYQEETKYHRDKMSLQGPDWANRPPTYKKCADPFTVVSLPEPKRTGGQPLWEAIARRRSERDYTREAISLAELSQLLWAAQGSTASIGGYLLRAAPSAGALYPVETYLVVNRVEELTPGIYHYRVPEHSLEGLVEGDFSTAIAEAALGQSFARDAAVVFVWTAVVQRSKWKYRERAYRYIYLDAGHIGENLQLAATAMGLGCCPIGAFFDEEVNRIIGADGVEEIAVYLSTVGRK